MNIPVIKNKIDFTDGVGTRGDENRRGEMWEVREGYGRDNRNGRVLGE